MNYYEFLESKQRLHDPTGFEVDLDDLNKSLFDWQKIITRWALFTGKAALFEGCGLGKTIQELEWSKRICEHTGGNVLILAPLAVAYQTRREGKKFGYEVTVCKSQKDIQPGINVANYDRLDKFDPKAFNGIVLDESSILKSFMGKTKQALIDAFRDTPYKLCGTATPSPNDYMELLNHSEFLNVMPSNEALSRWFINDTAHFGTYRIRGHAEKDFWKWVSSWAVCVNKPSDIGFDDNGFILPPLNTIKHIVDYDDPIDYKNGKLFKECAVISASNLYRELRETAESRCKAAAELVNSDRDGWIIWCNTNKEAELLFKLIDGQRVNVHGSMSIDAKEDAIEGFLNGDIKTLITKPSMCGFGLNFQHVNKMVFVGLSFSFEQRYQAVRRLWRFGQEKEVFDHIILSPAENQVFNAVIQKEKHQKEMEANMVQHMKNYYDLKKTRLKLVTSYETNTYQGKNYKIILGDAIDEIKKIDSDSVHLEIFSPPFSNLYIYSDMLQDMGNCKNDSEFFAHFDFLIQELYRILVPGRLCVVHCKDLVDYKNRDGEAGLRDFPGETIRRFEKHGFKYHSRVTIWKDPVIEMQRTKAQGLLHAQIKRDSSVARAGLPDYLIVFRKWPDNSETSGPNPVIRPDGFKSYIGTNFPIGEVYTTKTDENGFIYLDKIPAGDEIFSIHVWQRYASPVWFDIQQTNVLNCRIARDDKDEKHICPLQLDVIRRAIHLWTNPGDVVFTPFAGIGSEIYCAIELGRYGIGIELKKTYAEWAHKIIKNLENKPKQGGLFD